MFHHLFFKKYIVTRTAIGKESLTALHSNCGKNLTGKLNQISSWRKKKTTWHPCYNIQPWLTSWNIGCCRVMLVWQTINDRVGYLDMDNGHWRIIFQKDTYTYISVGDIGQIFRKWLLFLEQDVIATVPKGRYCCRCRILLLSCSSHMLFSFWSQRLLLAPEVR